MYLTSFPVSQPHFFKRLLFSHYIFLPPLWKTNFPYNFGFISGLSVLLYWLMCLFLCHCYTVLISTVLYYILKSVTVISPVLFFFKIALAIQGLLWFHRNFRIIYSSSMKNSAGILIGMVLKLYVAFGAINISTIFFLPIYEHGMSSHFFVPS